MSDKEKLPYTIVEAPTAIQLMEAVISLIEEGYVPLGGVQVLGYQPIGELCVGAIFYQTMVFNEAP